MKYAIAGITGHTGKIAAKALLARGHQVRAIVRDAAKAPPGTEAFVADLGDVAATTKALSGVDGAYLLVPPHMGDDVETFNVRAGELLAQAVRAAQPKHVVFLSSIGVQHKDGTGPIKLLHPTETLLRDASANVTFIRAAQFFENLSINSGTFVSFTPATLATDWVASRDIGALAASLLVEGPRGHEVIALAAKERYTPADIARIANAKLVEAPVAEMANTLVGFGLPRANAKLYQEMTEGLIAGRVTYAGDERRVVAPTSLADFFAR